MGTIEIGREMSPGQVSFFDVEYDDEKKVTRHTGPHGFEFSRPKIDQKVADPAS